MRPAQSLTDLLHAAGSGPPTAPFQSNLSLQVRGPPRGPLAVTVPGAALPPKVFPRPAHASGRLSRAPPTYTYDYGTELDATVLDILRKSVQNGR
jgi:hypothetical protein